MTDSNVLLLFYILSFFSHLLSPVKITAVFSVLYFIRQTSDLNKSFKIGGNKQKKKQQNTKCKQTQTETIKLVKAIVSEKQLSFQAIEFQPFLCTKKKSKGFRLALNPSLLNHKLIQTEYFLRWGAFFNTRHHKWTSDHPQHIPEALPPSPLTLESGVGQSTRCWTSMSDSPT